jgi:hypothetical protein
LCYPQWPFPVSASRRNNPVKARRTRSKIMSNAELLRLRRREKALLQRIEKMKQTMNETQEMDTLALQMNLLKKAKEELNMVQEKLAKAR